MKFNIDTRNAGWVSSLLRDILRPEPATVSAGQRVGRVMRQGLAVVLSALMIMVPMGQPAFGQEATLPGVAPSGAPPAADAGQQAQPLSAAQLDQLVAPIALYPDALVAQILGAATYPTQVVEADRWRQSQGNATPEQIAAGADAHNWDPSVKALTAFPTVLAQMDRNLQWTTDLGNAYYNQPQDVMDSVQAMRQKAQAAGQLRSTPQQTVTNDGGAIAIAPANPTVVYVPVYNPWVVYGAPLPVYPGFYYAPPPDIFWGGLAIGFGVGIGIGVWSHWGWGWHHWGMGWHEHNVYYNHNTYITRSTTVINRGYNRPGGPPRGYAGARGAYARPANGFNRTAGNAGRPNVGYRGANGVPRPGSNVARPGGAMNRPGASMSRPGGSYGRPGGAPGASAPRASASRMPSGGGHASPGGHPSGGHPSGGHSSGHQGHGR